MKTYSVEATARSPFVNLDAEKGKIDIKGRSIPENTMAFWQPIMTWVEEYIQNSLASTEVHVQLDYFNTSSTKCILDTLKKLETIKKNGKEVKVFWYYEDGDEDMFEAGEDYSGLVSVPFEIIMVDAEED